MKVLKDTGKTKEQMKTEKEECIKRVSERNKLQHQNQVKMDLISWIAMLIVALPLYLYHWGLIKKEHKK
mgnify:CR=1 FL=1